jgi:hypothetical protein
MANVPHWLVQSYATFDSGQQRQALAWTMDNMSGLDLAEAYRFARYYRPAMNRDNQYLVDMMGWRVQQEKQGGSMAGYANYAPAMSGYSMGAYMPTMGSQADIDFLELQRQMEESSRSFNPSGTAPATTSTPPASSGDSGIWGFLGKLVGTGGDLLKTGMQNQPGSQFTPGGVTPGIWDAVQGKWVAAATTATTTYTPPPPTTATPKWLLPALVVGGAVAVGYAVTRK